ncbi:MAG: acetylornithine deacetylase [Hyphomicrobiales bacterium]|nr:acetylornithine deacetylase [Hyphomicrobiales bacterium]
MTLSATEILARLVAFDTTSRNSNLPLIEWVEELLSRHGVPFERVYDPTGTKACLWATVGPKDVAGYVLSGHTDVVPVDDQDWATDPFTLTEVGSRLYGRGTSDMKGFSAVFLSRLEKMLEEPLAKPIHICLSHDEEVGCIGVRNALARIDELAPVTPLAAFVGEPTEMAVVVAHKAKWSYRVSVRGHACHSSLAPKGVNAIEAAAEVIAEIRAIGRDFEATGPRDPLYDVPFSTSHVGVIHGGTALNIVPEHCVFEFEFRMLAGVDHQPFEDRLRAHVAEKIEPWMKARAPEAGITLEMVNGFPGFDTPPEADATVLAKRLAGRNDHTKVAYGTEAGLFVAMAKIPTVVVGPGSIGQAHIPNEFIEKSELDKCGVFVDRLIDHCRT